MCTRLRSFRNLVLIFMSLGFVTQAARADGLYSVKNLGIADSSGNYLNALSAADQASFTYGSFDIYAHPGSSLPQYASYLSGGVIAWGPAPDSTERYNIGGMTTGNNLGVLAGVGADWSGGQWVSNQVAIYVPDPRSLTVPMPFTASNYETVNSPGYVYLNSGTASAAGYSQFYGSVGGINDHNNLALTEYTYSTLVNGVVVPQVMVPHLDTSGRDISLGSLGGTNGVANALNNANQVVGWSQISSGARHAFLYSNGAMQDLNAMIPTSANITPDDAVGIDGSGRIVAYGTDSSGQTDEFLLTPLEAPVPEPSTLAIFGLVIAALAAQGIRSRRLTGI